MPADCAKTPTCAVVADTCCDMPTELLAQLGVAVCSRRPSADELIALYSSLLEQGYEGIVSVHKGIEAATARAAVASMGAADRVTVVDANLTSIALALVVERTAHVAAAGGTAAEVSAAAEAAANEVVLLVISDSQAPRQGNGDLGDRFAYLRRRALGMHHLVSIDREGHKVIAASTELSNLTGRLAQSLGTRARTDGALCYIEAAGTSPGGLSQLEKPFDTNEYVSYHLATFVPAPELVYYAGPESLAVAVIPEAAFGGHETSLFDCNHIL